MVKPRVLLVEDEPTVALLIKESLTDLSDKFTVERAASGEEAMGFLKDGVWDVVVTDNRMPGITGLELIENLRERAPQTRTILITAYGSEEVEEAARRLKVYHYLTKPFPLARLKQIVQEALAVLQEAEKIAPEEPPALPPEKLSQPAIAVPPQVEKMAPEEEPPARPPEKPSSAAMAVPPQVEKIAPQEPPARPPEKPSKAAMKVTLGGDGGVGKTSLIRRLCTGEFDPRRCMTIGVEFHIYDVQHDSSTTNQRLIVWDVSGQDHFEFARRAFYRGSKGVGLVYDTSNRHSFERMPRWYNEIRVALPKVPVILAGNKTDQARQVGVEEGRALAAEWGVPFFETSCTSGQGVREFFGALASSAEQFSHA